MIVKMLKAYAVARQSDKDRLLARLRQLGVLHLVPVETSARLDDESLLGRIAALDRATQLVSGITPSGELPDVAPEQAASEILRIHQQATDRTSRLNTLYQQVRELELWGDVRLEQLRQLQQAGLSVVFAIISRADVAAVQADVVQTLRDVGSGRVLIAAVGRDEAPVLGESAQVLPLPSADVPSLKAEAAQIDAALAADRQRLADLAALSTQMAQLRSRLARELEFARATRGGMQSPGLFAVQGYVPQPRSQQLREQLSLPDMPAAVELQEVGEDESPPTQIRYPRWVKPIKGLFDILGIQPGYREMDITAAFTIALPFFAAMLISDGGYGLLFMLVPLLMYRKAVAAAGRNLINLVIIIGAVSVAWGVMTGSFFGVDLLAMVGFEAPIPVNLSDESRWQLMSLSFYIGAIHLIVAKLWRAIILFPRVSFLSQVGWAMFLWFMLGMVRYFVLDDVPPWETYRLYLLIVGGSLAILFGYPSRNLLKMVGLGVANFPLAAIGTFSDIMSYVRLMAVGLAGSVLAVAFNELAVQAGPILMVPVLVIGHGLNIGLVMIALFAHGVRLNVLEFSNNIGMEWSGYPYQPFADDQQET